MPIYEYRCGTCGHTFDRLMRLGVMDVPPCPACGATDVRRLVSAIARPTSSTGNCGPAGLT